MIHSKYASRWVHSYREVYEWLCQTIHSLSMQTEGYEELGFYGFDRASVAELQNVLRDHRDQVMRLSLLLKQTARLDNFEAFRQQLLRLPEGLRPAFPKLEAIEDVCDLLSSIKNRLEQLANFLDGWPEVKADAFTGVLNLALRDLVDCRAIILEHDICGDGNSPSPEPGAQVVPAEEEADFDGFRSLPTPDDLEDTGEDDLHRFRGLDPDAEESRFDPGETYQAILEALHSAQARIRDCLAVDQPDRADESNPAWQRFLECREALLRDISAATSACDRCYANADAFVAWLSHYSPGDRVCASLELSAACFLLDAGSMLSAALKRLGRPEITDEDSIDDMTYDDVFEEALFKELDRKFEELYGTGKADPDDTASPAEFEADFADRLMAVRNDLQGLLSALQPK